MKVDAPVPFAGSHKMAKDNFDTHIWQQVDECEVRCFHCDSKPWHAAAFYPCGAEVPRQLITM